MAVDPNRALFQTPGIISQGAAQRQNALRFAADQDRLRQNQQALQQRQIEQATIKKQQDDIQNARLQREQEIRLRNAQLTFMKSFSSEQDNFREEHGVLDSFNKGTEGDSSLMTSTIPDKAGGYPTMSAEMHATLTADLKKRERKRLTGFLEIAKGLKINPNDLMNAPKSAPVGGQAGFVPLNEQDAALMNQNRERINADLIRELEEENKVPKFEEPSEFVIKKMLDPNAGLPRNDGGLPPQNGSGFGTRADGTEKGSGFLGELKRPDGGISTELSVGVNFDGEETEIPLLVPTLTKSEIDSLLKGERATGAIMDKAVNHARMRMKKGLSPFKESRVANIGPKHSPAKDIKAMESLVEFFGSGQIEADKIEEKQRLTALIDANPRLPDESKRDYYTRINLRPFGNFMGHRSDNRKRARAKEALEVFDRAKRGLGPKTQGELRLEEDIANSSSDSDITSLFETDLATEGVEPQGPDPFGTGGDIGTPTTERGIELALGGKQRTNEIRTMVNKWVRAQLRKSGKGSDSQLVIRNTDRILMEMVKNPTFGSSIIEGLGDVSLDPTKFHSAVSSQSGLPSL